MTGHSSPATRDSHIPVGYKQTEVGVIPEDWEVRELDGRAVILHGFGFKSEYFTEAGEHRLTTPGHFYEGGGFRDLGDKQKFYDGPVPSGFVLDEGDLIVAMTEQAEGLLGSAALVPIGNTYLHNQRLGKVRALSPDISVRFLYRIFNSPHYRAKVCETAAGTKVKHTSPAKLLDIPVPLPPTLTEQQTIAGALSDTDGWIASLEGLIAKKRHLKQAAMQQLLTGKKRLPGFDGEWDEKRLGELLKSYRLGGNYPNNESPTLFPLMKMGNVSRGEFNSDKIQYVSNNITPDDQDRLKPGDVLFNTRNTLDLVGKVAIWRDELPVAFFNSNLLRLDFDAAAVGSHFFMNFVLNSTNVLRQLREFATGTTSVAAIYTRDVLRVRIWLPSDRDEQRAIAEVVEDMDAEIAALETKLTKARQIKQGMMQELLTGKTRLV